MNAANAPGLRALTMDAARAPPSSPVQAPSLPPVDAYGGNLAAQSARSQPWRASLISAEETIQELERKSARLGQELAGPCPHPP